MNFQTSLTVPENVLQNQQLQRKGFKVKDFFPAETRRRLHTQQGFQEGFYETSPRRKNFWFDEIQGYNHGCLKANSPNINHLKKGP